jgi:hypothetical protein
MRVQRERLGQQPNDGDVALERSVVKRRQPKSVSRAQRCAILDKHLAESDVARVRSDSEHTHAVSINEVQRRA